MLHQLRDGCCCATVLAEAPAEAIAKVFGVPEPLPTDAGNKGSGADLTIAPIEGTPWSMVDFAYRPEFDDKEGDIDSDPLVRQGLGAMSGDIPAATIGSCAPVTTAAKISHAIGCQALGIWASDQGEGIGGGALFRNGKLDVCLSAAGAKELALIQKIRVMESDDEKIDDLLEELEKACEDAYWRWQDGKESKLQGDIDNLFNQFMLSLGMDAETCLELYDDLLSVAPPHGSYIVKTIVDRSFESS